MPGLSRRAMAAEAVSPAKIIPGLKENTYFHAKWPSVPPFGMAVDGDPGSAMLVATGNSNLIHFPAFNPMVAINHIKGAGQSLTVPIEDATNGWLKAGLDEAVSEGVEYVFGGKETIYNPFAMAIPAGTAGSGLNNKFVRLKLLTPTVGNLDECALGFRNDGFEANLDDYTDLAAVNIQYDTDAAYIRIETILNDDPTVVTETGLTLIDDAEVLLEVRMNGNTPRFYVNGQEFRTAHRFDVDDVIYPFFFWLQNSNAGAVCAWKELTIGAYEDDDESSQF